MSASDFSFYFTLGWKHIISTDALDHQLFILALAAVYTLGHIRQVLILVTAFTIGHSLTLVLSVLDVVRFPADWVEFLIPCTILLTGISNLFRLGKPGDTQRLNYFLALFFGLIHGMGFANAVRIMLARDQKIGWSLFGFNLGLEVGQIVVVSLVLLLAKLALNVLRIRQRDWILFLSSGVIALSLQMVLERVPF
ncbi:MAG: HupE/UreJ family protein [Mucilaginibacter polytrichastri]|nr:HupE/UreJ family protein [Mucilaginibacter polytrichastri]